MIIMKKIHDNDYVYAFPLSLVAKYLHFPIYGGD